MVAGEEARKMLRIHFKSVTGDLKKRKRDFPGGPVVFQTWFSSVAGAGSIPMRELRSHMP